jgi:hypothetical protein
MPFLGKSRSKNATFCANLDMALGSIDRRFSFGTRRCTAKGAGWYDGAKSYYIWIYGEVKRFGHAK